MKFLKHILVLVALLFTAFHSFAQDFKLIASASHTEVSTGDRFQIEFTANDQFSNFKAPNLSDFRVLSGPNQSTNMSWVNGNMTAKITYSYILMAVKEGEFTLSPAVCAYQGKAYNSNSLTITVKKGANVQQPNSSTSNQKSSVSQEDVSNDLFIKASVNKTTVYQGEQLIATYQLYTKVNVTGSDLVKNAALNGFWSQEIDLGQTQWSQEVIGGYRWHVATIRKIVLFPQRSGNLEIDPLEMNFIVPRRVSSGGGSVFDQFFGRVENAEYSLKSKPIKIKVLPHPDGGKPESFNGAVGQLEMTSNISSTSVKANEAINLKIKISGKGNIPLVDELAIKFPDDFETYDPKVNDNIKTSHTGVAGSREYDYLIIPRHAGNFTIDPVEFSYFDPSSKTYKTIKSDPFTINVEKGEGGDAGNITYSGANKEDVEILGSDIRYIHVSPITVTHSTKDFYGSWLFYLLILIAPILFLLTLIFRNKIRIAQQDVVGMKSRKASKVASKHLAVAKKSLDNHQQKEFYENISRALFGYVSDKLHIKLSELNKENIAQKLNHIQISEATTSSLIDTLEMCDMARFAPISVSEQEIFSKAEKIINQIEEEAKK